MKSITDKEFLRVFQDIHKHLTTRGLKPSYLILDNKYLPSIRSAIQYKGIYYQVLPPGIHQRKTAESSISISKDNFNVGLWSTDPYFTVQNWYRLFY